MATITTKHGQPQTTNELKRYALVAEKEIMLENSIIQRIPEKAEKAFAKSRSREKTNRHEKKRKLDRIPFLSSMPENQARGRKLWF